MLILLAQVKVITHCRVVDLSFVKFVDESPYLHLPPQSVAIKVERLETANMRPREP